MVDIENHRVQALADGVYAVALTLLVLELKLPELPASAPDAELLVQMIGVLPKIFTWLISFVLLAFFWLALHRLLRRVKVLDGPLLTLCFVHILLVALSPFVIAIYGSNVMRLPAQVAYNTMLSAFCVTFLIMLRHIRRMPPTQSVPFSRGQAAAMQIRFGALVGCAGVSTLIAIFNIRWFGLGYAPMFIAGGLARWLESRIDRQPHSASDLA